MGNEKGAADPFGINRPKEDARGVSLQRYFFSGAAAGAAVASAAGAAGLMPR
jgi:hypothetical protein